MNYRKMKVDELLELMVERGLEPKDGMLKADLVAMLEEADKPVEVEAEVVEDEMIPRSAFKFDLGNVQDDIVELTEAIDSALTMYGNLLVDDEVMGGYDEAEAKQGEHAMSAVVKRAEDARKALKRNWNNPYAEAEARYKELMAPVNELHGKFKQRRINCEDERKGLRLQGLERTYWDYAEANGFGNLPTLVPFQALLDLNPHWMNKGTKANKAAEEVEARVDKIIADWQTLRKQQATLPFYAEAEAEFFRTLDTTAALDLSARRDEEQRRIDAVVTEREEVAAFVAPEPVKEPAPKPTLRPQVRRRYHFEAWLSESELASFREWKNACDVGEGWTFRAIEEVA